jgi:hypothetical protein
LITTATAWFLGHICEQLIGHVDLTKLAIQASPMPNGPACAQQPIGNNFTTIGAPNFVISRAFPTLQNPVIKYPSFGIDSNITICAIE